MHEYDFIDRIQRTGNERKSPIRLWTMAAIIGVLIAGLIIAFAAHADPKGQIPQEVIDDPRAMGWFKQPRIAACCSTADGYAISQYEIAGDQYRGPDPTHQGEWLDVPNEAVVWDQGNPTPWAWIWLYPESYVSMAGKVRCFIPAGGA
jgi:hypothetical protein